jgi:hypothetical protein
VWIAPVTAHVIMTLRDDLVLTAGALIAADLVVVFDAAGFAALAMAVSRSD